MDDPTIREFSLRTKVIVSTLACVGFLGYPLAQVAAVAIEVCGPALPIFEARGWSDEGGGTLRFYRRGAFQFYDAPRLESGTVLTLRGDTGRILKGPGGTW